MGASNVPPAAAAAAERPASDERRLRHDLQNSLAAVRMAVELATDSTDDQGQRELLERALRRTTDVERLVDALLALKS